MEWIRSGKGLEFREHPTRKYGTLGFSSQYLNYGKIQGYDWNDILTKDIKAQDWVWQ